MSAKKLVTILLVVAGGAIASFLLASGLWFNLEHQNAVFKSYFKDSNGEELTPGSLVFSDDGSVAMLVGVFRDLKSRDGKTYLNFSTSPGNNYEALIADTGQSIDAWFVEQTTNSLYELSANQKTVKLNDSSHSELKNKLKNKLIWVMVPLAAPTLDEKTAALPQVLAYEKTVSGFYNCNTQLVRHIDRNGKLDPGCGYFVSKINYAKPN